MISIHNIASIQYLLDALRGESGDWTIADWRALPKLAVMDLQQVIASFILDHTGELGNSVINEVMRRRSYAKAVQLKAEVFCSLQHRPLEPHPPAPRRK